MDIKDIKLQVQQFKRSLDKVLSISDIIDKFKNQLHQEDQWIAPNSSEHIMAEFEYLIRVFQKNGSSIERVRILLPLLIEQAIDYYWYKGRKKYNCSQEIAREQELFEFHTRSKEISPFFGYIKLVEHWSTRIPNSIARRIRRLFNHPGGRTMGLMNSKAPLAIIALLNELAIRSEKSTGLRRDRVFLVTSILRTTSHQAHLAKIGYYAPPGSSHVFGYSADIEQRWIKNRSHKLYSRVVDILKEYEDAAIINCIDYKNHWHICLNPEYIEEYKKRGEPFLTASGRKKLEVLCAE